jgi:hypothetical protein
MYAAFFFAFIILLWSTAAFIVVYVGAKLPHLIRRKLYPTLAVSSKFRAVPVALVASALMALLVIGTVVYWSNYGK